jgi:hypothetical protein
MQCDCRHTPTGYGRYQLTLADSDAVFALSGLKRCALTRRHWIIARSGHGPFIPCIPVILIARHMASGRRYEPGARPCLGVISLSDYRAEFASFDIEVTDA